MFLKQFLIFFTYTLWANIKTNAVNFMCFFVDFLLYIFVSLHRYCSLPASFSLPWPGHPASAWAHQHEWYQEVANTLQRPLRGGYTSLENLLLRIQLISTCWVGARILIELILELQFVTLSEVKETLMITFVHVLYAKKVTFQSSTFSCRINLDII